MNYSCSSLIQTLLSVPEFWWSVQSVTGSAALRGSRTLPPVGNSDYVGRSPCPEEFSFIWLYYITNFIIMQYKIKKIWNAAGVFCIPFIFFTSKCQLERTPVIIIWIWFAWENSSKYRNVQVFALIQKMLLFEHLWCEFSIFCIVLSKVLYFLIL